MCASAHGIIFEIYFKDKKCIFYFHLKSRSLRCWYSLRELMGNPRTVSEWNSSQPRRLYFSNSNWIPFGMNPKLQAQHGKQPIFDIDVSLRPEYEILLFNCSVQTPRKYCIRVSFKTPHAHPMWKIVRW